MKSRTAKSAAGETEFSQQVGAKAARKLKAQRHVTQTVWSGLGMMGMVGWSVAVPTLLGAALGLWLDKHYPGKHSWTLTLLVVGLVSVASTRGIGWPRKAGKCARNRRITMNEPLTSGARVGSGRVARSDFFRRSLVDGASRAFRPNSRRSGFSAACCCGWALRWPDFTLSAGGHWERLLLCLLGFVIARLVVTWLTRPSGENHPPRHWRRSHAP